MSKAAMSVYVFGIYLGVLGIILVAIPNLLLSVFGIPETQEVWIRVVGMLVLLLSLYYMQCARHELTAFLWLTVYARMSVIIFFVVFVLAGLVHPVLILFGAVDFLGAIWTWRALKSA